MCYLYDYRRKYDNDEKFDESNTELLESKDSNDFEEDEEEEDDEEDEEEEEILQKNDITLIYGSELKDLQEPKYNSYYYHLTISEDGKYVKSDDDIRDIKLPLYNNCGGIIYTFPIEEHHIKPIKTCNCKSCTNERMKKKNKDGKVCYII